MRIGLGISVAGSNQRNFGAFSPAPAPSGIPVATTNLVFTFGSVSSGSFLKQTHPTILYWLMQDVPEGISFVRLSWNFGLANAWYLEQWSSGEESSLVYAASNSSANSSVIPTSGWTYTEGSGLPITITAA